MSADDYVAEEGAECRLKVRPIEAPFNIFGTPAFIGYYVQHNWGKSNMSWAPHTDSGKAALSAGVTPQNTLRIKYDSENTPNGDVIAFAITLVLTLSGLGFWLTAIYYDYKYNPNTILTGTDVIGYSVGGFLFSAIFFVVCRWILLLFLMPGNNVHVVPDAGEASERVSATHMSALAFLTYFAYKVRTLFQQRAQKREKQAETVASNETTAEIDELINSIE